MTLPETGPSTLEGVKAFLGGSYLDGDATDDAAITACVRAVNARVRGWPCAAVADGAADWTADAAASVVQGADMLASRLFRRRNSPDGVAAFAGDSPLYIQRNDPDVALLLGLGAHAKPAVG